MEPHGQVFVGSQVAGGVGHVVAVGVGTPGVVECPRVHSLAVDGVPNLQGLTGGEGPENELLLIRDGRAVGLHLQVHDGVGMGRSPNAYQGIHALLVLSDAALQLSVVAGHHHGPGTLGPIAGADLAGAEGDNDADTGVEVQDLSRPLALVCVHWFVVRKHGLRVGVAWGMSSSRVRG